jgi:hypothetical protein
MSNDKGDIAYQKTGFSLSSWNYGSFHHCNPFYQQGEYIKSANNKNDNRRSDSVNPIGGKRILKEEEKIVTEEYLKNLKEYKIMKGENRTLTKNKSASILKVACSQSNIKTQEDCAAQPVYTSQHSISKQNITTPNSNFNSKKNLKYQLNFKEWALVKDKQQEIFKKVKKIKEDEDKNFEYFNKKIDENYQVVK